MYEIIDMSNGDALCLQGHYTAVDFSNGNQIKASNLDHLKRMVAVLNTEPLGYVIGPAEKLSSITPKNKLEEDPDVEFTETLHDVMIHGSETAYGLFLAPLH